MLPVLSNVEIEGSLLHKVGQGLRLNGEIKVENVTKKHLHSLINCNVFCGIFSPANNSTICGKMKQK